MNNEEKSASKNKTEEIANNKTNIAVNAVIYVSPVQF